MKCRTLPAHPDTPHLLRLCSPDALQVYFKLNAINNCKQPLQQIEVARLFDNAKQAHKVTLR